MYKILLLTNLLFCVFIAHYNVPDAKHILSFYSRANEKYTSNILLESGVLANEHK